MSETKGKLLDLTFIAKGPGSWRMRHQEAVLMAAITSDIRYSTVRAVECWIDYARAHEKRFESTIGEDSFLGPAWAQWGRALLTLLNGELGPGVDAGTLDAIIRGNLDSMGLGED